MIKYKLKQFWLRFCIRSLFFACFSVNLRVKKSLGMQKPSGLFVFEHFSKRKPSILLYLQSVLVTNLVTISFIKFNEAAL
jgi:hypothetical protein